MRLPTEKLIAIAILLQTSIALPIGNSTNTTNSTKPYHEIKFRYPVGDEDISVSLPEVPDNSDERLNGEVVPYPQPPQPPTERISFTLPKDHLIADPDHEGHYQITIPVEPREDDPDNYVITIPVEPEVDDEHYVITIPVEPNHPFKKEEELMRLIESSNNNNDESNQLEKRGIIMAIPRFIYYCHLVREFGHIPWLIAKLPERVLLQVVDILVEAYKDEEPMMDQGEKVLKQAFTKVLGSVNEELNAHIDELKMDTNYFLHYFLRADISRGEKVDILVCLLADLEVPDGLLPKEWPDYIHERDHSTVTNSTNVANATSLI